MRLLKRNQRRVIHAEFIGKTEEIRDGLFTGEWIKEYTEPVETKMTISAARGQTSSQIFGIETKYTKTMITDDINCPITESSLIWIDIPSFEDPNYKVVAIARSLNFITYAIQEIKNEA